MSGFTTTNNAHLIRSSLWSSQLKDVVLDDLMGMTYVNMISDFPDGDTINIPSIGQPSVYNYAENMPVKYSAMDTGNFQFSITDYKASGVYVTKKMLQDSYVMSQVQASFVPKQHRALMEAIEQRILAVGPEGQTSANSNTINGGKHRFVGTGPNNTMAIEDFAKIAYALKKTNMPGQIVGIVSPEVEMALNQLTNIVSLDANPMWEGIVATGLTTGTRFSRSIFGIDLYVSNHLKLITTTETIDGVATGTNGVANIFFSVGDRSLLPIVGQMRQPPQVDSEYNKDRQREEYVTTARYGFKLFRPENLVTVITAVDQVYA